MSNNAFHHKDSKIQIGMYYALCIMGTHFDDEMGLRADSIKCAAQKATEKMHQPDKLGRSYSRRCAKMQSAIEVAIARGWLRYSGKECRLTLTREGRKLMKNLRKTRRRMAGKKPGYINSPPLPTAA